MEDSWQLPLKFHPDRKGKSCVITIARGTKELIIYPPTKAANYTFEVSTEPYFLHWSHIFPQSIIAFMISIWAFICTKCIKKLRNKAEISASKEIGRDVELEA